VLGMLGSSGGVSCAYTGLLANNKPKPTKESQMMLFIAVLLRSTSLVPSSVLEQHAPELSDGQIVVPISWNRKDWSNALGYKNQALTLCEDYCDARFRLSVELDIPTLRSYQYADRANAFWESDWEKVIYYDNEALVLCGNCSTEYRNSLKSNIAIARAHQAEERADAASRLEDWERTIYYDNQALISCESYCSTGYRNRLKSDIEAARSNRDRAKEAAASAAEQAKEAAAYAAEQARAKAARAVDQAQARAAADRANDQANAVWQKDWAKVIEYKNQALTLCADHCDVTFRNGLLKDIANANVAVAWQQKDWAKAIEYGDLALALCTRCDDELRNAMESDVARARSYRRAETLQGIWADVKVIVTFVSGKVVTFVSGDQPTTRPAAPRDVPAGPCTAMFGTGCPPADVQLTSAPKDAGVINSNNLRYASSAAKDGTAAATAKSIEEAKHLAGCDLADHPCTAADLVSFPQINGKAPLDWKKLQSTEEGQTLIKQAKELMDRQAALEKIIQDPNVREAARQYAFREWHDIERKVDGLKIKAEDLVHRTVLQ